MFVHAKAKQKQESKSDAEKKGRENKTQAPNTTGIPDKMKLRYENMSGFSFDDVQVHYNSDKPVQLQALAYTQSNQVYIAPGQERHLPHELGHVVQQKSGSVYTTTVIGDVPVNDDEGLEREADSMSLQTNEFESGRGLKRGGSSNTVQRYFDDHKRYKVDGQNRSLYAQGNDDIAAGTSEKDDERTGIMYEVICRDTEANTTIANFNNMIQARSVRTGNPVPPETEDVGLSIVVNRRASNVAGAAGQEPTEASVSSISTQISKRAPYIHVEKVAWGYLEDGKKPQPSAGGAEPNYGGVPFFELRKRAASNSGAKKIYNYLNNKNGSVWRRMGDNDITFHDPSDGGDRQITKLKELEGEGKEMVTFAYNLTSPEASFAQAYADFPPTDFRSNEAHQNKLNIKIKQILELLYELEARVRKMLVEKDGGLIKLMKSRATDVGGITYYPAEPTTYYKATTTQWDGESLKNKSQQIKEGASIKDGLGIAPHNHEYVPDISEDTGAGNRNDALIVALVKSAERTLEGRYRFGISMKDFVIKVTSLNQSYFNPTTFGNMLDLEAQDSYKKLIESYLYGFFRHNIKAAFD